MTSLDSSSLKIWLSSAKRLPEWPRLSVLAVGSAAHNSATCSDNGACAACTCGLPGGASLLCCVVPQTLETICCRNCCWHVCHTLCDCVAATESAKKRSLDHVVIEEEDRLFTVQAVRAHPATIHDHGSERRQSAN